MFPILESDADPELSVQVSTSLAVGNVSEEIIVAIRLGRMTALSKPDGGVREIVVGRHDEEVGHENDGEANHQESGRDHSPLPARSQPKQGVSASLASCRTSPIRTRRPPSSQLMAWGRTI